MSLCKTNTPNKNNKTGKFNSLDTCKKRLIINSAN